MGHGCCNLPASDSKRKRQDDSGRKPKGQYNECLKDRKAPRKEMEGEGFVSKEGLKK